LQLAVTYEDVLKTTTRTAIAIMEDIKENSLGIHIPPFVKQGIRPLFAIDNIDLGSDAGSLHGADLLIAQKYEDGIPILGKDLKLDLNIQDKAFRQSLGITYYRCISHSLQTGYTERHIICLCTGWCHLATSV